MATDKSDKPTRGRTKPPPRATEQSEPVSKKSGRPSAPPSKRSAKPPYARHETMEVETDWLELIESLPPPTRDAARRGSRAPVEPGRVQIRDSIPVAASKDHRRSSIPARHDTLEVKAEWLETVPPPGSRRSRAPKAASSAPPRRVSHAKVEVQPEKRVRNPWEPPPLPPPPATAARARRKLPPPLPREDPPEESHAPRRSKRPPR